MYTRHFLTLYSSSLTEKQWAEGVSYRDLSRPLEIGPGHFQKCPQYGGTDGKTVIDCLSNIRASEMPLE